MVDKLEEQIKTLAEHPELIKHPGKKKYRGHWKDLERVHKIHANAKWDARLAEVAARLIAAGFTYDDVGVVLGVEGNTVTSWTQTYESFFKAAKVGHAASNAMTLGQLLRAAWGYDYTETTIKRAVTLDENGEEIPALGDKVIITEHNKHQPPNADLLKFICLNRMSDEFKDSKRIEIEENRIVQIVGSDEERRLDDFIAKFIASTKPKQVESKVIESSE